MRMKSITRLLQLAHPVVMSARRGDEADALFAAMAVPPTGAREQAYRDYIQGLKDNGLWDDLGALYIACSEAYNDSHINVISPADTSTYTELAGVTPSQANAWITNVGLKTVGQGIIFGYHRTKWAQNAMPGFNRDTVCYGVMQNGSSAPQQGAMWQVDSGNAGTLLSLGWTGGVSRGNISHTAITLGNQSSGVVDGSFNCNAMTRASPTFVMHSINGGAFQLVGATPKGQDTTYETNKLSWHGESGYDDGQRIPIMFAFKTITNAKIALMSSLSKTFLKAINVPGWRTYATWDPASSGGGFLSGGNLTAQLFQTGGVARSTIGKSSGKWYFEISIPDVFSSVGVTETDPGSYTYGMSKGVAWRGGFSLTTYKNGVGIDTTLGSFAGTVMGIALDMDNLMIYFYRNGVLASEATINPVTLDAGTYKAAASRSGPGVGSNFYTANFGATPFAYTPPSGFNAGLYD